MDTIGMMVKKRVERYGNRVMMKVKRGGIWREISWSQFYDNARNLGIAMISLGIQPGDRIAMFSPNSPEWQMVDIAAVSIGVIDVPLYATITAKQAEFIIADSGSKILFVGTDEHLKKALEVRENLPDLMKIVTMYETKTDNPDVMSWNEFLQIGKDYPDKEEFDRRLENVKLDDVATLIYTSGTTGNPKGVMLTHGNLMSNVETASKLIKVYDTDVCLSFLPLSHSLERMSGYYTSVYNGVTIAHASSIDALVEELPEVRPHYMVSVPRLYEKVYAGVKANVESEPPLKQKIFNWAVGVGRQVSDLKVKHKPIPPLLDMKYKIANKLVFSKVYEKMGGRLRFCFSGGAPLSKEIAEFFHAMGILILEGYGLTETSPVISVNTPEAVRFGSVGKPIPEVEVEIADDGEILARGPNVMKGYWNRPEETAEAMEGGWFHTGDIGFLDKDNFLYITDRKKDIIVTSGGKNVAPQNIENTLKLDKFIEQVCVIGDKRKYLSALIVPNFVELEAWAKSQGISYSDRSELLSNERVYKLFRERIDEALKDFAKFEQIVQFTLLPEELSIEAGLLTPTLKVRRKQVMEAFKNEIDKMYPQE